MTNMFKALAFASVSALAVAAPMAANAVVVTETLGPGSPSVYSGSTLDFHVGDIYDFALSFDVGTAGYVDINFMLVPPPSSVGAVSTEIYLPSPTDISTLVGGTVQWLNGGIPDGSPTDISALGPTVLGTTFTAGETETLRISWDSATVGSQITAAVAAVPVPATGFLLLGGIGAIGAFRRKKKAVA